MADFDPFANQGGPAAWDPEHTDDSKKQAEELLKKVTGDPGAGPSDFGTQPAPGNSPPDPDDVPFEEGTAVSEHAAVDKDAADRDDAATAEPNKGSDPANIDDES